MPKQKSIALIHVGKTGGTYLKSIIRDSMDNNNGNIASNSQLRIILPKHITLAEVQANHGKNLKYGFVFRDPTARFVSAFYSRLRMGRPEHDVIWDNGEATAFSFFATANALAEALDSKDQRQKSAAIYAMQVIRHLYRGYYFHFGDPLEFALNAQEGLLACIDLENLDANLEPFLAKLGISPAEGILQKQRPTPSSHEVELSSLAQKNLRAFWIEEYEYFEMFKELERCYFE